MTQYFITQIPVPKQGQIGGFPAPPGTRLVSLTPFVVPPFKGRSSLVVPGQRELEEYSGGSVVAVFELLEGSASPFNIQAAMPPEKPEEL